MLLHPYPYCTHTCSLWFLILLSHPKELHGSFSELLRSSPFNRKPRLWCLLYKVQWKHVSYHATVIRWLTVLYKLFYGWARLHLSWTSKKKETTQHSMMIYIFIYHCKQTWKQVYASNQLQTRQILPLSTAILKSGPHDLEQVSGIRLLPRSSRSIDIWQLSTADRKYVTVSWKNIHSARHQL